MYKNAINWSSGVHTPTESRLEKAKNEIFEAFKNKAGIGGEVVSIEKYGVFVRLGPHINGLLHVSEISTEYVLHPEKYFTKGQYVLVEIISYQIDSKKNIHKISLSTKNTMNYITDKIRGESRKSSSMNTMEPEKKYTTIDLAKKFNNI